MAAEKANMLHIFFNAEHKAYMYGAVHIVDGSVDNQWWERPFVVSKRSSGGEEIVYGTVKRTLQKILLQVERLKSFQSDAEAKLKAAGITPLTPGDSVLPESETTDRILNEQDNLVEDVLLAVSVNIRILSEIFRNKFKRHKVSVYDYDGGEVGRIALSNIADLLLHNRYLVIKGPQVVDLISDKQFLAEDHQMGLSINVPEFLSEVDRVVSGLTIKDLVGKLWAIAKGLSTTSSMKDIVFLTQNLYTLGDSVVRDPTPVTGGPLKTILDRVARNYIDRMYPNDSARRGVAVQTVLTFRTPRFYLEPDLDHKQIKTEVQVNGSAETLVMDYEEFFREVSKASGNARLYENPDH